MAVLREEFRGRRERIGIKRGADWDGCFGICWLALGGMDRPLLVRAQNLEVDVGAVVPC